MYDFASTIFSMNVISLYFALWVIVDKKGQDIFYSIALSTSMLLAALTSPILGAVSDHLGGRRMPFLIVFVTACAFFTMLIGVVNHLLSGLIFFVVANYCFQVADTFYNALLPTVSDHTTIGRVSGYGTGLGYCGTIVGLLAVSPFAAKWGRHATFIPTALFYFIFSLPCFFLVKDKLMPFRVDRHPTLWQTVERAFLKIRNTVIHIKQFKGLFIFFIAIFISFNAINTVFVFMSVYTKEIMAFSNTEIVTFYIVSSSFAIVGALLAGFITDKFGPKRTLTGALILWSFAILAAGITTHEIVFWIIGPCVGIGLGTTWTSSRALAIALSPAHMIGEIFGFYGLMGKTAAIVGPLVWGFVVLKFQFLGMLKYRIAVLTLLLFLILGVIILQGVPCPKKNIHCQKN
jgi:UMF1 family MFS transporter